MSRWILVALVAVATSSVAVAERVVIRGPELAFACPTVPNEAAIASCIKAHGWTSKVLRKLGRARIYDINAPANPFEESHARSPDVALYVQQPNGTWSLGGLFEPGASMQYELLDAQELTIAHTHGFRVDIGTSQHAGVSLDGVNAVDAIEMQKHVLYCNGTSYSCTEVITSCDVVIEGHVYATFHGDIKLDDRQLHVVGDGRLASPLCSGPQDEPLEWQ